MERDKPKVEAVAAAPAIDLPAPVASELNHPHVATTHGGAHNFSIHVAFQDVLRLRNVGPVAIRPVPKPTDRTVMHSRP